MRAPRFNRPAQYCESKLFVKPLSQSAARPAISNRYFCATRLDHHKMVSWIFQKWITSGAKKIVK
jgi:hypothetical protein